MKQVVAPENLPIVIVDDLYAEAELELIWGELGFLTSRRRLLTPDKVGAAVADNGKPKKFAGGVFLDSFYGNREASDILALNRKLFCDDVLDFAQQVSPFYRALRMTNSDQTLVNYYESGERYDQHNDLTVFTAITSFYREPKCFTGGDLEFPEYGRVVECKHNRLIIFPGVFEHAITPVAMTRELAPFSGHGRYGMAQFLTIEHV